MAGLVPAALVAVTRTVKTPATVGVPEIVPAEVSTVRPAGSPETAKDAGLLLASIWYPAKTTLAVPLAVAALEITGTVVDGRIVRVRV
jgi:hypothetical protein